MSERMTPKQHAQAMMAMFYALTHPEQTAKEIRELFEAFSLQLRALKGDKEAWAEIDAKFGTSYSKQEEAGE